MRIAIDISSLEFGGKQRQVTDLAAGLADAGDSVLQMVSKSREEYSDGVRRAGFNVTQPGRGARRDVARVPSVYGGHLARPHARVGRCGGLTR